ncbi:hypothetical protein ACFWZ3_02630 [Frateuria sp. GZRR35]|uniref:hypothetical protein n=1 Tax=unclassified Frateuria TaxID=2648894 RepID=UPI003EDBC655
MSNTIELLETIGGNAALRYASTAQLAGVLERADASSALRRAICSGNGSALLEDFGHKAMHLVQATPQITQMIWREMDAAAG